MQKFNTITVFFFLLTIKSFGQAKISFHYEKNDSGYTFFVDNNEFCPVSFQMDLELTNLQSSNGNHKIFVVPAKTSNFSFTELKIISKEKKYGFSYKTLSNYGDATLTKYDANYNYSLPFQKGNSFKVYQGYNGTFSHQNENSLDFTMPVGTPIVAARDGIVIAVVQSNNQNCAERKCAEFNNYILLYHPDGTFSRYVHLKQNGAVVKEGEAIKEGQLIGYSGNVGWSNGPHLHFMVFMQKIDKQVTVKTKFKINDGSEAAFLIEKKEYLRNY